MKVTAIPALASNYFWCVQPDGLRPAAFIVDPGDAEPVLDFLAVTGLQPRAILITHHHRDHTGGIAGLTSRFAIPVYGPRSPLIPNVTHVIEEGDRLELEGITFDILGIPGHTLDHIAYVYAGDALQPPSLFCGDTLFAGGCGRRFEGTGEQMWASLLRLSALADETLVYCGHEYTLDNLRFAATIEPDNLLLLERLEQVRRQRDAELPTLPTSIGIEKLTNPFLRCHLPQLKAVAEHYSGDECASAAQVFAQLRYLKDAWH